MIVGAQPEEGSQIPGIRKWPPAYLPKIFDASRVDRIEPVTQPDAEHTMRRMAREEGIFGGVSTGLNVVAALQLARELGRGKTVATVAVDAGLKYLAGDLFEG